jgi:hypothetical protein
MAQQEWVDLLEVIYEESDFWEMDTSMLSRLEKATEYEEDEVKDLLDNLQKQGLIKRDMEEIILTERGFEFISEKKTHEEQMLTQRLLLVFVTALSLATLVDTVIKLGNQGNIYMNMVYSIVFAIVFIVLGMIAKQKAGQVENIEVDGDNIEFDEEATKEDIEALMNQYEEIQGKGAVGIARKAMSDLIDEEKELDLPEEIVPEDMRKENFAEGV